MGNQQLRKGETKMNILEQRIKESFPNEDIEVIFYKDMKSKAIVKCKKCNTEYSLQRGENFIRKGKKCVCRKCVNNNSGNKLTLEEFQNKIDEKYPQEKLKVLKYKLYTKGCEIQCENCGSTFMLDNASSFLNKDKKRVCKKCFPNKIRMLNKLKEEFLNYMKDEGKDKFELLTDISDNKVKSESIIMSKCKKCGYVSGRVMRDYLRGRGCPQCANNKLFSNEEYQKFLKEEYTLLDNYKGMNHSVLIKHNLCGFCYKTNARHYYCPKCSGSKGEKTIAFFLEQNHIKYEKEKLECIKGHNLRFDFYLNDYDVYIEFQGEQHLKPISYFGGEPTLLWNEIIVPLTEYATKTYSGEVNFGITTNGTLLNEERIKFLYDHQIMPLLSIDGAPET